MSRFGFAAILLAALWAGHGRASSSLGFSADAGNSSFSGGTSLDLELDAAGEWSSLLDYSLSNSWGDSASQTHGAALSLHHEDGSAFMVKSGLNYSNDTVNKVWYAGPSFGFDWSLLRRKERGLDLAAREIFSLGFEADINAYTVDVSGGSGSSISKKGIKVTASSGQSNLYLTQFCPSLSLEAPLFKGLATPSVSAGHYFYSADPAVLAGLITQLHSSGSGSAKVNNMVGALYSDTWKASLQLSLPWQLKAGGGFGEQHMVSPDTWNQVVELSVSKVFFDVLRVEAGWSQSDVPGAVLNDSSASITCYF